jgi:prevent-host-death family protein
VRYGLINMRRSGEHTMLVNIDEAKTLLTVLLERVQAGEEIVIARAGEPIARLTPIRPAIGPNSSVRFGGLKPARLKLAADFHAAGSDDDLLAP